MAQLASNVVARARPPPFGGEGKLDGTNYTLGKFKLRSILDSYELWEIVLGSDRRREPILDPADPTITILSDRALLLAWRRRNVDVLCAFFMSVMDTVMTLIQHTITA